MDKNRKPVNQEVGTLAQPIMPSCRNLEIYNSF